MSNQKLQDAFASWRAERLPLVLATVFETKGSTYSKAGAYMLVTGDGRFQGMLSGGCLEGDLAERASAVITSGTPQAVTYDLATEDEALWGLGVGCDGLMRVFLQPLSEDTDYQPFASIVGALNSDKEHVAITVIASSLPTLAAGASLIDGNDGIVWTDLDSECAKNFLQQASTLLAYDDAICVSESRPDCNKMVLFSTLKPRAKLLVLGAGLDAEPVVRFADELGMRVTVCDHRPAYLVAGDFALAEETLCWPAKVLGSELELDDFAACVVMSHHLETDRIYLEQIAASSISYVGLLGPMGRKHKLLAALGSQADLLVDRLHGPAGLDIGARGPAPIALSIIAEVQQHLAGRRAEISA